MIKRHSILLWGFSLLLLFGCGGDDDANASHSGSNGEILRAINASNNENRTIRFPDGPIAVHIDGVPDAKDQVKKWTDNTGGLIQFHFVNSSPSKGIVIRPFLTGVFVCGATLQPEHSNGVIEKAEILIDPKSFLSICQKTVAHEIGHALGLLGHLEDGGLMDPDGGSGKFTSQLVEVISILYSIPPNTDITNME